MPMHYPDYHHYMYAAQQHHERQQEAFTQHIIDTVAALSQFLPPPAANMNMPELAPELETIEEGSMESTTVNTPIQDELALENFISGEFAEELEKALTEIS